MGATCAVQVELDPLSFDDEETLHRRIRQAFDICRSAVDQELATHEIAEPLPGLAAASENPTPAVEEGQPLDDSGALLVTERQLDFLDYLARQVRALGRQRLKLLAEHLYGRPIAELTAKQGSQLIDLLKEMRAGARSVEELLPEAAA
jgi:hypothetical protein